MRAVVFPAAAAAVAVALAACVGGGGPLPDQTGQTGSDERSSSSVESSGERDEGNPVVRDDEPASDDRERENEPDAAADGA